MKITQEKLEQATEGYDGFCTICDDITRFGDTEPDAENYLCPQCDEYSCHGVEQAVMEGLIEIE